MVFFLGILKLVLKNVIISNFQILLAPLIGLLNHKHIHILSYPHLFLQLFLYITFTQGNHW
jgi:hypothetical protein